MGINRDLLESMQEAVGASGSSQGTALLSFLEQVVGRAKLPVAPAQRLERMIIIFWGWS